MVQQLTRRDTPAHLLSPTHTPCCLPHTVAQRTSADVYEYEGLGDNYHSTPWVPPQITKAKHYREASVYGLGRAPICSTGTADLNSLGVGVTLYFRFLKYLTCIFFLMTVLAIPVMYIAAQGSRIPQRSPDLLGLSVLTIGNVGDPNQDSAFGFVEDINSTSIFSGSNHTFVDLWGWELTAIGASYLISFVDFINVWLFIVFLVWMYRRFRKVEMWADRKNVRAADFTVFVRGLPRDTEAEQVRNHFSRLFGLVGNVLDAESTAARDDAAQWPTEENGTLQGNVAETPKNTSAFKKPPMARSATVKQLNQTDTLMASKRCRLVYAEPRFEDRDINRSTDTPSLWVREKVQEAVIQPVMDVSHNGHEEYYGSWVADVNLARPNGRVIRAYLASQNTTAKLRAARAKVKMYSADTPYSGGPSEAAAERAERKVLKLGFKLNAIRARHEDKELDAAEQCVGAFVTFHHEESTRRCLDAYSGSNNWFRRLFQRKSLRFNGTNRLNVQPAPDPSDVIWENLETTKCQAFMRRRATGCLTFFLIILSFALILSAHTAQQRFLALVPPLSKCNQAMPEVYFGGASNFTEAQARVEAAGEVFKLERPPLLARGLVDGQCPKGQHWITYPNSSRLVYSLDACDLQRAKAEGAAGTAAGWPDLAVNSVQCADVRRTVNCPCVDPSLSTATCFTMPCFKPELKTSEVR